MNARADSVMLNLKNLNVFERLEEKWFKLEDFLLTKLAQHKQINLKIFTDSDHALDALLKGNTDAILSEYGWAKVNVKLYSNLTYFVIETSPQQGYAIAFPEDSSLLNQVDNELIAIKASEEFWDLQQQWGLV